MKVIRTILLIFVLLVLIIVIGGAVIYGDTTRGPLPQATGSITVPGLDAPVEILRDRYGIPHIYASTMHDVFFAQGLTQAQDRWWQMEFARHIGSGAIQELTGANADVMGTDVFIRTAGWREAAERDVQTLPEEVLAVMQAFADGVNAYIRSRTPSQLALEYRLLGLTGVQIEVEDWTPVDTIVWGKVMSWNLTDTGGDDQTRDAILASLGPEMLADYIPQWPYGESPTIVDPADLPVTADSASVSASGAVPASVASAPLFAGSIRDELAFLGSRSTTPGIGSNNWVSTGTMTESGTPLLANDPHLGIQMPAIWYEIGLHCWPKSDACPLDVRGFALPASPGIIIGHNDRIAWGVTNVGADVLDLYRLTINPENELQYEWNGEWRDFTVRDETIHFGDGGEPVTFQVRETHFGPVLNDNRLNDAGLPRGFNNEDPLAMRWTGLDEGTLFQAVYQLNLARDWNEFRTALSFWNVPAQNFVYADINGNIGYQMPGSMPIRPADVTGTISIEGSSDAVMWQGYIPYDNLPRILNPERDYIATANQAVVPLEYYDQLAAELGEDANYLLSTDWSYGQRGGRINDLMNELAPLSIEDYRTIHGDNFNEDARVIVPFISAADMGSDDLNGLRDWLGEWNLHNDADSGQAALFAALGAQLLDRTFNDQLPEGHETFSHFLYSIGLLMDDPQNAWWDDVATSEVETRDDIIRASFEAAVSQMRTLLGTDQSAWRWGAVHTATFVSNPLGLSGISLIEDIVNRGPQETGGGFEIVNATGYSTGAALEGDFGLTSLPSMRQIIDVANFDNSLSIITTGQSGHPFSPHYDDQIESWAAVDYHPMLFTRPAVEAQLASALTLTP